MEKKKQIQKYFNHITDFLNLTDILERASIQKVNRLSFKNKDFFN